MKRHKIFTFLLVLSCTSFAMSPGHSRGIALDKGNEKFDKIFLKSSDPTINSPICIEFLKLEDIQKILDKSDKIEILNNDSSIIPTKITIGIDSTIINDKKWNNESIKYVKYEKRTGAAKILKGFLTFGLIGALGGAFGEGIYSASTGRSKHGRWIGLSTIGGMGYSLLLTTHSEKGIIFLKTNF